MSTGTWPSSFALALAAACAFAFRAFAREAAAADALDVDSTCAFCTPPSSCPDEHPASTVPAATTTTPALPIPRRPIESSKRADDTPFIPSDLRFDLQEGQRFALRLPSAERVTGGFPRVRRASP
ncbi:hypothetical protein GCM10017559_10650 [Streptosporangium longisporum]|uniref:Uncharacterized protein n=1 Tax=Streptosporangium longisporum TaxID=46187 RepID=A0ABN1K711_9ACTN